MTYSTAVNGFSGRPGMDASADAGRDYSRFSGRGRWGNFVHSAKLPPFFLLHCKQTHLCGTDIFHAYALQLPVFIEVRCSDIVFCSASKRSRGQCISIDNCSGII